MGRIFLLVAAAAYWLALLVTVIALTAVGHASDLRHPLYLLLVALAAVLAGAVLRWPPRRSCPPQGRAQAAPRPPRQRPGEPPRMPVRRSAASALSEITQLIRVRPGGRAQVPAGAQSEPAPAALVVGGVPVGDPTEIRDFGAFLDVREEGYAEGYDMGYDDASRGRPHRRKTEGS